MGWVADWGCVEKVLAPTFGGGMPGAVGLGRAMLL